MLLGEQAQVIPGDQNSGGQAEIRAADPTAPPDNVSDGDGLLAAWAAVD
jgi:hypothetical protein